MVSPVAKLNLPLSVIVWPSVSRTGTLDATLEIAPEATVKPPEKTYCRLDVLVPIRFRLRSCLLGSVLALM